MAYRPGVARVGEPTPQTNPELFTDDEILAEIKHLIRMNKRYGSHPLRTVRYLALQRYLTTHVKDWDA